MVIKFFTSILEKKYEKNYGLLTIASLLLAIWIVPHTLALRNFLLAVGFILSLKVIYQNKTLLLRSHAWPVWLLFLFFPWLLIHAGFFSTETQLEISNIFGPWVRVIFASIIGLALGLLISLPKDGNKANSYLWIDCQNFLLIGLASIYGLFFIKYVYQVISTRELVHSNFFVYVFDGKSPIVVYTSLLLPLVFLKMRDLLPKKFNMANIGLLIGTCLLILFSIYFSSTKSGMIIFGAITLTFFISFIFSFGRLRKQFLKIMLLLSFLMAALFFTSYSYLQTDSSIAHFTSDVKLGFDIEGQQWWKNKIDFPKPINELGEVVNESVYERTAAALVGLRLIMENPMGYGLVHHSYGALRLKKWPESLKPDGRTKGATHSGLIDFTLGMGLPGILMVLIPILVAFYRGKRTIGFWSEYVAATVPWLIIVYFISEVSITNFIELLFFITTFFSGITLVAPFKQFVKI